MENKWYIRFKENVAAAESMEPLYTYLTQNAENLDASYLLRSEYVLLISALDTYIHMVIEEKIAISFFDINATPSSLELPISEMKKIWSNDEINRTEMLKCFINEKLKQNSFQSPKSIEYAFSLVNINKIWTKIKAGMEMEAEDIKKTLALIIHRRNMIAHESDRNRVSGELQDINLEMVIECKEFLKKIVFQIEKQILTM